MSLHAIPKRYLHDGSLRCTPTPKCEDGQGLWVECEVMDPPSSRGKTVMVYLAPDVITPMLLELRTMAIDARL